MADNVKYFYYGLARRHGDIKYAYLELTITGGSSKEEVKNFKDYPSLKSHLQGDESKANLVYTNKKKKDAIDISKEHELIDHGYQALKSFYKVFDGSDVTNDILGSTGEDLEQQIYRQLKQAFVLLNKRETELTDLKKKYESAVEELSKGKEIEIKRTSLEDISKVNKDYKQKSEDLDKKIEENKLAKEKLEDCKVFLAKGCLALTYIEVIDLLRKICIHEQSLSWYTPEQLQLFSQIADDIEQKHLNKVSDMTSFKKISEDKADVLKYVSKKLSSDEHITSHASHVKAVFNAILKLLRNTLVYATGYGFFNNFDTAKNVLVSYAEDNLEEIGDKLKNHMLVNATFG